MATAPSIVVTCGDSDIKPAGRNEKGISRANWKSKKGFKTAIKQHVRDTY